MNITIEIFYISPAGRTRARASYPIHPGQDEHTEAIRYASAFFRQHNKNCGYRAKLTKAVYNGQHDITIFI